MQDRPSAVKVRRADDFPPTHPGANHALCCTCTCCCIFLVGAGLGGATGLGFGIAWGIRAVKKAQHQKLSKLAAVVLASVGGFLLLSGPLVFATAQTFWALIPLVGAVACGVVAGTMERTGQILALVGLTVLLVVGAIFGGIVIGGGIGLALDFAFGTFK